MEYRSALKRNEVGMYADTGGPSEHTDWKKPGAEGRGLGAIQMKLPDQEKHRRKADEWLSETGEGRRAWLLVGFLWGLMKIPWNLNSGDGCTTLGIS